MVHNNAALIDEDHFFVDRKFHDGLSLISSRLNAPIVTVHPRWDRQHAIMDMISKPVSDLPYRVVIIDLEQNGQPTEQSRRVLEREIEEATLVVGQSFGAAEYSRRVGVPYIMLVEYDLQTQIVSSTAQLTSPLRRLVRSGKIAWRYFTSQRTDLASAHSIHCNGYPIFEATTSLSSNRLLYLDSRILAEDIITEEQLEERLSSRSSRPLRLLFSGRYTAMKGVADVVRVGIECQKRGLDIELALYGQGEQRGQLEELTRSAPDPTRFKINDPVTFEELTAIAKGFDVFVCCHVQSDPSCTYLESFGAGLPVVGYDNRMWKGLQAASRAGMVSPMHSIEGVAASIQKLTNDHELLADLSRKARRFALEHSFEKEFSKRIEAMRDALDEVSAHG